MKTLSIIVLLLSSSIWLTAQTQSLPAAELKTLDGVTVSSAEILDANSPTVVVFWKSRSNRCCDNLENMQSAWLENLQQRGVKMIAICTDCNGSWSHVKPLADGKNWEFDIYIDTNGEFKRAMNVGNVPCTMLFDQDQNLLCRNTGYCSGNEELICEKIIHSIEVAADYTTAK